MSRTIKKITPEAAADLGKKWRQLYEDTVHLVVETSQYLPKSTEAYRHCSDLTANVIIARCDVEDEFYNFMVNVYPEHIDAFWPRKEENNK